MSPDILARGHGTCPRCPQPSWHNDDPCPLAEPVDEPGDLPGDAA